MTIQLRMSPAPAFRVATGRFSSIENYRSSRARKNIKKMLVAIKYSIAPTNLEILLSVPIILI